MTLFVTGCDDDDRGRPPINAMTVAAHELHFPIASGKHADISCATCHGEEGSFREFTCFECHEHDEEPMNATHAGFADYAWDSQRCYACHKRGNILEEIDHSVFPVREGAAHEGIACADCHTNPADRVAIGCTVCHEHELLPSQAIHDGIPGYEWASASCFACHPGAKPIGDAEHPFFPTATDDQHEGVSCAACHASREDRSALACVSCHEQPETDPAHSGVAEYLYESSSCFLCHPGAEVPGTLSHTFFPIGTGAAHEAIGCAGCHVNPESRDDVGCTSCHDSHGQTEMATVHTAIPDYGFDSPACLFCHPNSEPTGDIDHEPMFPIAPPAVHAEFTCRDCHTNQANRATVACISCHEQPESSTIHGILPGYQWDSASCLACHERAQPTGAIDHTFFPVAPGTPHEEIACTTCHLDPQNRALVGCTSCHETTPMFVIHDGIPTYAWDSADCVRCHDSAQPEGLMDHTALFPVETGDAHAEVSCAECHAEQADRSLLLCSTCHLQIETDPPHLGVPEYLFESSSCFLCHPNAEDPGSIQHTFFPVDAPATHSVVLCAQCHTNPATRLETGCTTCHEHEEAPMGVTHDGVPGYAWDSSSCLFCHPNGEPMGNIDHSTLFPIAAPAPHQPVSCNECHTNPADRAVLGCATCHAAPDTDPFHAGVPGYVHDSPACLGCHPAANKPGLLGHSSLFPIAPTETHGVVSCAECHASQTDRAQLLCATCHTQAETAPLHSLVTGYEHTSPSCLICHPQGEALGAMDHTPFFPIAQVDTHGGIACSECHLDNADPAVLGCATCHTQAETAPLHIAVPGYEHTSPSCLTCHPYGQADGLSAVDHVPLFPIGAGTDHAGVGCAECHIDGNNLTINGCAECHSGNENVVAEHDLVGEFKPGTLLPSSDCKKCHADAQVHSVQTHGPFLINSGPHKRRECLRCHIATRTDKTWATDFEPFSCASCHAQNKMDDKHSGENGYAYDFPTCLDCHPQGLKD